jgi:hypothetical protein
MGIQTKLDTFLLADSDYNTRTRATKNYGDEYMDE